MVSRSRVVGSVAWLMLSHVLALIVGFGIAIVLARAGAEDLGRYRFAQAVLMYLVVGADAGMTLLAVREIARRPDAAVRYAGPVILVRFGLSLALVAAALALVAFAAPRDAAPFYAVMFLSVFPLSLTLVHVFQGLERLQAVAIARVVTVAVAGAVGLAFYLVTGSLIALVVPSIVIGLMVDAAMIVIVRNRIGIRIAAGAPADWLALVTAGFPFLITALAVQLVSNADAVIIGSIRGEAQLGLYAAAYVLAGQTLFLAGPIAWAIYPRLSSLHARPDRFVDAVRRTSGSLGLFILPASVGAAVLAGPIIALLYGAEYRDAAVLLAVLMGMPLIGFYNVGMGQVLNAAGQQRAVARVAILAAGVNVGANLLLVPLAGPLGAAIAAVVTEVVTAAAYTRAGSPLVGIAPLRDYLAPIPATLIMAGVLGLLWAVGMELPLPLAVAAGFAVYAAAILVRPPAAALALRRQLRG